MSTDFGTTLKSWRTARRMSQMDLGLSANVSARHISFLETGRSRPSRTMVLQLCEELAVPRAGRNQMLTAAGLAPAYGVRNLNETDMAPVRGAVDWMLQRHDPYPALALDRHWRLLKLNRSAATMLAGLGVQPGDSLIRALAENAVLRSSIENLDEVLVHTAVRLRTEIAHLGGDDELTEVLEILQSGTQEGAVPRIEAGLLPAFIPTRFRMGGLTLSLFSTLAQFGTVEDVALAEMKIEMMFPADDATRAVLQSMAG